MLQVLHLLSLDSTSPERVRSENGPVHVAPRDVVAASLPDPATIGPRMTGKTCAGLWGTGTGTDGAPREVYLYYVADNEWTKREYESQCVVWQTALNPHRTTSSQNSRTKGLGTMTLFQPAHPGKRSLMSQMHLPPRLV